MLTQKMHQFAANARRRKPKHKTIDTLAHLRRQVAGEPRGWLNTAHVLILSIMDGGDMARDYKAPHANRAHPARPRDRRGVRGARLFKGHRI